MYVDYVCPWKHDYKESYGPSTRVVFKLDNWLGKCN